MEVDNELSAAGVLELAWTTGLIRWEDDPQPGWYDTQSGDLSTRPNWSSVITTPWSSASASANSSTTARSTRTMHRRCWCRCSSTRTSPSSCRRRPMPARSRSSTRSTRSSARSRLKRLAGYSQGRHRDSGAAQEHTVARRRRPDPDRVRPDRVGHQPGHAEFYRPVGGVEHCRDGRRVPDRGLQPGRSDALRAPQPGGQHYGHRHGRWHLDAEDVPRKPVGP